MDVPFKVFRRFNEAALRPSTGLRARLDRRALEYFEGERLADQLARALAHRRALPIKEVFESFEFFGRVRRRVRAPDVADLCCGHGLTGALFGAFEQKVERVWLLDKCRPQNHDAVLDALGEVAPWTLEKIRYLEEPLSKAGSMIPTGASVVAVHACGMRTDRCLEVAMALGGAVAVMPCCYNRASQGVAPEVLRRALGAEVAMDVDRTYRLVGAGYKVDWDEIPAEITPMNRVLIGLRS